MLRSGNGLIFQSRRFRHACLEYRLQQEFITSYKPEQNGMIERFFRSLKEECVWQRTVQTFEGGRRIIRDWGQWYNQEGGRIRPWGIKARPNIAPNTFPGGLISGEYCKLKESIW